MKQFILIILVHCTTLSLQQRVAPGVPPQHYQQPPPPQHQQHQQHQPQYQQQVPINHQVPMQQVPIQQQVPIHQQVPIQQQVPMHQQVPMQQQVPVHQQQHQFQPQHVAHDPHGQLMPGQILNAANMEHEKEHLAEHLNVNVDTSKMSEQELQFHYFKMHDADNNNKLDGCELIKSLIHWHGDEHSTGGGDALPVQTDEELQALVDPLLKEVDQNKDGYIDYSEFKQNEANRP